MPVRSPQIVPQIDPCMFHLIDVKRVWQTMGELSVFDYVAAAFLGQLAAWRSDVFCHSREFERRPLTALVHKMKGSCQAVAATAVAHEFEQAERALSHMQAQDWPACHARLVSQLVLLEAEIRTIMARPDGR
jgi:hypothetical protein